MGNLRVIKWENDLKHLEIEKEIRLFLFSDDDLDIEKHKNDINTNILLVLMNKLRLQNTELTCENQ